MNIMEALRWVVLGLSLLKGWGGEQVSHKHLELVRQVALHVNVIEWEEWGFTLEELRDRYEELKDAPHIDEARRFPSQQVIWVLYEDAHQKYRQAQDRVDALGWRCEREWRQAHLRYMVTSLMYDAVYQRYSFRTRKFALLNLRYWVGRENFYLGIFP